MSGRFGACRVASRHAVVGLLALLVLLVGTLPAEADTGGEVRSEISEQIDAFVTERMAAHEIPGASVAVVRGGRTVHLAGYGTADPGGRPVTPDTPFLLGSVSKPLTATAVLALVDAGVLLLEDRALEHLPALQGEVDEGFADITVAQLLTHTSGISMTTGLRGLERPAQGPDALDRRVADIASRPLTARPGERYDYSNANYILLAAIIEQVTGEPFADVVRATVLDPLGMDATFVAPDDPRRGGMATGHRLWFGSWRPADLPDDPAGAAMGFMGSTARDLSRFMHAHLADPAAAPVVPRTARELAAGPAVDTGWNVPLESRYTTGWAVDTVAGQPVVSHAGSLAHFTAHVVMVPSADDLGIAVQTNASAFIAAGHTGQYDMSLGLTALLLDEAPRNATPTVWLTVVVPVAAWVAAGVVLLAAARFLGTGRPRLVSGHPTGRGNVARWLRHVVGPAAGYLAVGGGLLWAAPLSAGRLFYPDAGWGLTVTAAVALGWGAVRGILGTHALARQRPDVALGSTVGTRGGSTRTMYDADSRTGSPSAAVPP